MGAKTCALPDRMPLPLSAHPSSIRVRPHLMPEPTTGVPCDDRAAMGVVDDEEAIRYGVAIPSAGWRTETAAQVRTHDDTPVVLGATVPPLVCLSSSMCSVSATAAEAFDSVRGRSAPVQDLSHQRILPSLGMTTIVARDQTPGARCRPIIGPWQNLPLNLRQVGSGPMPACGQGSSFQWE